MTELEKIISKADLASVDLDSQDIKFLINHIKNSRCCGNCLFLEDHNKCLQIRVTQDWPESYIYPKANKKCKNYKYDEIKNRNIK